MGLAKTHSQMSKRHSSLKEQTKNNMKTIVRTITIAGTLFCAVSAFAETYIAVNVDNANVRTAPSLGKPVTMELFNGYPLKVLKKEGDWYKVVDFEGDKGWIHKKITRSQDTVIINAKNSVNMREKPSTKAKVIASVERGVVLHVIEKKNGWTKVKHAGGTLGWIYSPLLWP